MKIKVISDGFDIVKNLVVPKEEFPLTDSLMFVFIASLCCIFSSPGNSAHAAVNDWMVDAE